MWPEIGVFGGHGSLEAAEGARLHTMCSGSAGLGKWHEDQTTDGLYIGEIVYAATMMIRQMDLSRTIGHGIVPVSGLLSLPVLAHRPHDIHHTNAMLTGA